jgi:hypothetical protein
MITPEQINQLLILLTKIADRQYTITGSTDWPILAFMAGGFFVLIGVMWADLRSDRKERMEENEKDHDKIWNAMRDCKEDCCPARNRVK